MKYSKIMNWQIGLVLRNVYLNPGILRIDLSNRFNINKSKISQLMNHLIINQWIINEPSAGKTVPVKINPARVILAGIEIRTEVQKAVIVDSEGNLIDQQIWNDTVTDISGFINEKIPSFFSRQQKPPLAMGVALPGPVIRDKNILRASHNFNLEQPTELSIDTSLIKCPVFFENDIRCCGWGIIAYRREKKNFLLFFSEYSSEDSKAEDYDCLLFGTAVAFGNKMYEGFNSCACECRSILHNSLEGFGPKYIRSRDKLKMKNNPELLKKVIEEYAIHVSMISNYLDVDKVYIGGTLEEHRDLVNRRFETQLIRTSQYPHLQTTELRFAEMGDFSIAKGASAYAMEQLFREPVMENPHFFYKQIIEQTV